MEKNARGLRLLYEHQTNTSSVYLFKQNGNRYLISIHSTFFGLLLKKKNHEFEDEDTAVRFFEKVAKKLGTKFAINDL